MDALEKSRLDNEFRWVERVSTLMDSKFSIGGFRFGLDPILGLFPIVGQGISFATALLLVLIMYRHGVSSKVATKMLLNVIVDAGIGAIPLLGNVFDFFFKANKKNIKLLKAYHYDGKHQGSAKKLLAFIFVSLLLLCVFMFYVLWLLGEWVIGLF
ncbi:DUF4112 domain-containing protein [Sphingobacterium bambusae]|uniref:DUF4112 domain-containing protein n=1 Tax=Sphingobacterium bambusae TaxID=662858 RepID=A0ABW6BNT4_9SPHI|nr:DUF4112 domain-containing protein [Sphingobacterium bambusae]WPL51067.1 DUF4112 domain-containing protein [Sphingobacterium bambusae]